MSQLLEAIINKNPRVVFFGEKQGPGKFRTSCFSQLSELRGMGFEILAVEIYAYLADLIQSACRAGPAAFDGLFSNLATRIGQDVKHIKQSMIDEEYCLAIQKWLFSGGKLICLDSDDPPDSRTTNDKGRDEFMARKICAVQSRVVAIIGRNHTFVREDTGVDENVRRSLGQDHKATDDQTVQRHTFRSVAEKVSDRGIKLFSVASIGEDDFRGSLPHEEFCLRGQTPMWTGETIEFIVGTQPNDRSRQIVAPELYRHTIRAPFSSWDALFFG